MKLSPDAVSMFSQQDYIQNEPKLSNKMDIFKLPRSIRNLFSRNANLERQQSSTDSEGPSMKAHPNLRLQKCRLKNPAATLLGCPGEIRNQIYSYVLDQPSTEDMLKALQIDRAINPNAQLAMVCQQIYLETLAIRCPSFLIASKHDFLRVKSCAGLTLPINDLHKQRMVQGPTAHCMIKNLVLRDYLHNIILYWRPSTGLSSYPIDLRPSTVYLQLCICKSIPWMLQTPVYISIFSRALENLLETYDSISRVVIYYCGRSDLLFPSLLSPQDRHHFPRLLAEGVLDDNQLLLRRTGCMWVAQEADDGQIGKGNSFILAPVKGDEKRIVKLDCFESLQICGKECVLE